MSEGRAFNFQVIKFISRIFDRRRIRGSELKVRAKCCDTWDEKSWFSLYILIYLEYNIYCRCTFKLIGGINS